MKVRQIVNSIFNSCSYVIAQDYFSWLVDCGDVDRIVPWLDGRLRGVLLTHAHFDHIYGLNTLLELFPNVPIFANAAAREALLSDKLNFSKYHGDPFVLNTPENVLQVEDGDRVSLFDGIVAQAVFTPGHSPGSVTWIVDDTIFTGDSFIPGMKTVTNLPHADKQLAAQSEELILDLSRRRIIYPGHASDQQFI